jgi:hypothetical protein
MFAAQLDAVAGLPWQARGSRLCAHEMLELEPESSGSGSGVFGSGSRGVQTGADDSSHIQSQ